MQNVLMRSIKIRGLQQFDKHCEIADKHCEIADKPQQGPRGFVKSNWKCKGPTCQDGHVQLSATVMAGSVEVVQVLARLPDAPRGNRSGPFGTAPGLWSPEYSPHSLSRVN